MSVTPSILGILLATSTAGLPLAPAPRALASPDASMRQRVADARLCGSAPASAVDRVGDKFFVACREGKLLVIDDRLRVLRSTTLRMYQIYWTAPAGDDAVAVSGVTDGAALQSQLALLNARTLQPIVKHPMSDSTFLGVYDGRAYIDDWCCFGRSDTYRPATVYSISLKDGSESAHVDLAPDPGTHPPRLQPIGQGESNYRIGKYFYVHVQETTYRYDLTDLQKPPIRMRSSLPWGPGTTP